jgi:hypothetical protein
MYARGGGAIAGGGDIVLTGDTGTELTRMTSSWKSAVGCTPSPLSVLCAIGSGVGGLLCGLLFGLVCLGARGGGGNS